MRLNKHIFIILISFVFTSSCKKFLNIDSPKTSVSTESVFRNDDLATSAILNLYSTMLNGGFVAGSNGVSFFCGFSADELTSHSASYVDFYENNLNPTNSSVRSLYSGPYGLIFRANSILEGLATADKLTVSTKKQLQGEAYFVRAFCYFYLVNLYGSIPLQLSSDSKITRVATKSTEAQIYEQMIKDLQLAETLLTDKYVTVERVRPNQAAAQALLARVYLYNRDWKNAEKYASLVIAKNQLYSLVAYDGIFSKNSQEAILQLFPPSSQNGGDGRSFILTGTPTLVSLSNSFVQTAFELNDTRRESWVGSFTNPSGSYYYAFKYKAGTATPVTEYLMVLRLAEQYLIRAEARIHQNNIEGGVQDLNIVRKRTVAGVNSNTIAALSTELSLTEAIAAVEQERRIELFSEWGNRWFDLKRTGRSTAVLSLVKPNWVETAVLFPLPYDEMSRNPNIKPQNPGY